MSTYTEVSFKFFSWGSMPADSLAVVSRQHNSVTLYLFIYFNTPFFCIPAQWAWLYAINCKLGLAYVPALRQNIYCLIICI